MRQSAAAMLPAVFCLASAGLDRSIIIIYHAAGVRERHSFFCGTCCCHLFLYNSIFGVNHFW